jgi:hypothetical protein
MRSRGRMLVDLLIARSNDRVKSLIVPWSGVSSRWTGWWAPVAQHTIRERWGPGAQKMRFTASATGPHLKTLIRSRGSCCERREAPLDFTAPDATATSTPSPCRPPLPRPMVRHTEPSHLLPLWCSIGFNTNRRKVPARSTPSDPKEINKLKEALSLSLSSSEQCAVCRSSWEERRGEQPGPHGPLYSSSIRPSQHDSLLYT